MNTKRSLSLRKFRRGLETLEFAIVLPIFIFLLLVLFDFGLAVKHEQTLSWALREGARLGSVSGAKSGRTPTATADLVKQSVVAQATDLNLTTGDVTVTFGDNGAIPDNEPGNSIDVASSYTYYPIGTGLSFLQFTWQSTARMVITY